MKDKNASQPLVSIVTPVYNGEKYLAECIESVLRQTYENWEYLIADNCSTDRSLEIARQYAARDSRLHVFENSEFVPAIENWNRALRHISQKSKYSKEIHADDMLLPECIERMVATAEAHPTAGVVSSVLI
jgi:glycosyltransferase involved in cell wall biosynthesis